MISRNPYTVNATHMKGLRTGEMTNGLKLIHKQKHEKEDHNSYNKTNLKLIKRSFSTCPKGV